MHATLRADAHVVAGPVWPLGPTSNAHLTRPEAAMPPVLAGPAPERGLLGRRSECEALDRLVADLRAGLSQVLVVRPAGPPCTGCGAGQAPGRRARRRAAAAGHGAGGTAR